MVYHSRAFTASDHYTKCASPPQYPPRYHWTQFYFTSRPLAWNTSFAYASYFPALQKCQIFSGSRKYAWNGPLYINVRRSLEFRYMGLIIAASSLYHYCRYFSCHYASSTCYTTRWPDHSYQHRQPRDAIVNRNR